MKTKGKKTLTVVYWVSKKTLRGSKTERGKDKGYVCLTRYDSLNNTNRATVQTNRESIFS